MTVRTTLQSLAVVLLLAALLTDASAQQRIEETRPATADTVIHIDTMAGSVRLIGWEEDRVHVVADVRRSSERLEITGDARQLYISLQPDPGAARGGLPGQGDLEVRIPASARVHVRTISGRVDAERLGGTANLGTVSGSIRVSGSPASVDARSVSGSLDIVGPVERASASSTSGSIEVSGPVEQVRASSTSGRVRVRGVTGSVEAGTVSGAVEVDAAPGAALREVRLGSTSGRLAFRGALADEARLEANNHSGVILLDLPASVNASFGISTFSGSIQSAFDHPELPASAWSGRRLAFITGTGTGEVSLTTFSGSIRLESH